jgi:ribosomal protein S18 acetylase RimI-like enzyme
MTATIRRGRPDDVQPAYYVCLKTGDHGADAEALYLEDPDALGRIYVGPYLAFEPDLALILEDEQGVCGYALGALDSAAFYARIESEWRPALCARFPDPQGDPAHWTATEQIHACYHRPDYFRPEPRELYPSHLHIDLLPRAQAAGHGRRLMTQLMTLLSEAGSPGVHLGLSALNPRAEGFYRHLGFHELTRVGTGKDGVIYMGRQLPIDTPGKARP